ncbi:serine-rich adhesin for platelets isoform X1 [Apis cerana]|uniref:serine-rich adhesin for platelets isoform X1 n=1 Tax=Apis cerana TaxID=7461 RepID=UPI002B222B09|nr:serine-rich adhesin for platelets isoform X1 [Apis cerana]
MVGRFSWCTTVVALVVLLLFVTTEGLRERSQLDDPKTTNRGTLRYHSKSLEEATTASTSTSRSRTARDRSVQSKRFSNLERSNEVSTQPSVIDFESKFDSTKNSIVRTTRTTERDISATEIKNDSRRASSRKVTENVKSVDSPINRRNGKRYFSETNEEAKLKDDNDQTMGTTKGISRRTFNRKSSNSSTERLDNKGPSVFLATTESSRSRTGRKIQTTYSMKDLKTQIPTSRRYTNKKFEDETTTVSFKRGRSTTERIEKSTRSGRSKVINTKENNSIQRRGPDPLLSESESVRVDIPLAVDTTQNPVPDVTTTFGVVASQRRSDVKESSKSNGRTGSSERSKNRGRLNDSETAGSSRSASRRGSSKFSDSTTAENNEQIVSSRRNTISRDRSRSSDTKRNSTTESRSRSRGRNLENNGAKNGGSLERDVKRKVAGERNSERRSRISEAATRIIENQDGQDTRGRSKGRMSRTDTTTPIITDVTTIVALDTTISNNDVTTTDSEVMATTIKPITSTSSRISVRTTSSTSSTPITESSGRGRGRGRNSSQGRKSKEDFFNHGLGFRGRKVLPEGFLNDTTDWRKSSRNEFQSHGNPGWTLRRRPAHLNNFENSSGTSLLSAREQTNEVIPPNEQSTTDIVTTESFSSRRGFKKLQTTEESSTMAGTTTKSYRRGNKTFGLSKTIAEDEESDNYPPEFKAKLKNINTKIPAPKTTSRTPLEEQRKNNYGRRSRKNSMAVEPDDLETAASANILTDESLIVNPLTLINGTGLRRVKKSSASLFAERSRKKLELARRLVKPELNIEENDLDATTASSFSKPKPTGVPVVDETSKVAKYAKPKATGGRNRTSTPLQTSWEEASVKASKLSSPRKGLEDSSKVTGRPYNLSKGRIIGEQIVTSISVEETPIEETTKPYANLPYTNPSIIGFAEEGAATTVDSTRIRPGNARGGKKSREESSVSSKNAKVSLYSTRRAEDIEPVTTIKPKKSYFSRNSKLQEQSTTVEQNSTTSKKSYGSAQRKSQAFQEEDLSKKSKFGSGVTKPTFRPRYIKRTKDKFLDERTTIDQPTIITKIPVPTSRYSRKKSAVKSVDDKSKSVITEGSQSQTKKLEFRPRTATYRRHSEVPTTLVGSTPKIDGVGVAITPRSAKYHATLKTSTVSSQSVGQEPQVNLRIANESAQETTGITGSSNGDSGNSNIFNPTKSTILAANNTLLEQLRSTVAPLLNSLGNRTPVFSGSYSNVNNANSSPRITPNGQPPRFSARYKGAELFVRKQNNIYQPTVPSVTSSSTTPVTPIENTGSAPPIDVSNPGQSKFLTLYQALESASIRNEQLLRNMSGQQQEGRQVGMVPQVDSNAIAVNVTGDNANNNATSPTVATTGPQTPDTTLNTIQDSTQTPRLPEDTENSTPAVTTGAPETPSTTEPVFTSTEPSSSTEQPTSTSTELFSSTEQVSTSTDSSSTGEQISTGGDSMSVTEQTTIETISRVTDATTMSVGGAEDIQTSAMVDNGSSSTEELVSSSTDISATTSAMTTMNPVSTTLMITSSAPQPATRLEESSTVGSNDAQSTVEQSTVGDVSSTTIGVSQDTVETSTVTSASSTFKNPETNTIPFSDTIATQTIDASSTDAPTTEADSNNMIDVETTTAIPVSTIRNRLIDFAQDILSRLQASLSTTVPSVDSTTFSPELTEISNQTISSNNRSLESLSQMKEETTLSSVTMDQSSLRNEEITTQSAVGSITTSSPIQEVNTRDDINLVTTTTLPTTTTTTIVTQDSQTISNTDSTTVGDSNSSTTPQLDVEMTTSSTITSTNDTLLTELMSIAKTLFSEEMNEQMTAGQNLNDTSSLENEVDSPNLSNVQLSTTQAAESTSVSPDVTTESTESTSTVFSVDSSQNEVDFANSVSTTVSSENSSDTSITTPRNVFSVDNEVESVQTNGTALESFAQIVESTTPSFTTEIGPRITQSNTESFENGLETSTTRAQTTTTSTQNSETISITNSQLTTNTFDLITTTGLRTTTEITTEPVKTTVSLTSFTTVPQLVTETSTNQSDITTVAPETTLSFVNMITTTPSTTLDTNTEQTTMAPGVESIETVNGVENVETNQAMSTTTQLAPVTMSETTDNETLEATTPSITTTAPQDVNSTDDTGVTTNQPPLISSPMPATEINTPSETTSVPQTTPNPENETPIILARFQDTTSTTAQGTAGSGVGQTTEITTPTIQDSSTVPSSTFESSASSSLSTDSTVSSSVETTTTTTTTTMTSTERVPDGGTSTLQTTRMDVFTVTPVTETTTTVPTTTVNIEENLISTGPTSTTETTTTTVSSVINGQGGTNDATSIAPESTTSSETTNAATTIASSTSPSATPSSQTATTPYLGRFGGSRLTPAPRFSLSSTTKAPLRDYLVYGIYPNKTIVRKRPEDNLIDARNVDSPYVIFGIFPDGRLVRKFPNGTIIPDPPRSPVEVVFSLSTTTTTNRPPPRPYYNQANQGTYNQYRGPVYYNNGIPVAEPMRNVQSPGTVDLGLTGNAIVGPNGGGPDNTGPLGTPASTNEMSNALLNTQMGTASVTPIVSTGRPPTVLQGGRIVQDRERDEATRTKEAGGQRSSVYIGQDKFVNYWTNGASTTNPRALSVNINSVASAANVGPSPSVPSFDNLLNNQPGNQVTAPPGFPWRDPLDQIFGITTSSPVITASVASNTLDDTMESNNPALPRPINPYVEVFTPFSSVIGVPRGNIGTIPPPPVTTSITSTIPISTTSSSTTTTTSMTNAPMTTTTTTMAPTTTTSTTTMAPTTTTTMAPTTTTTTTTMASTTTTMAPTTTSTTTTTAASTSEPATATQTNVQMMNLLNRPQQNAFGTSIDDLVFLNSLLQNDSRNSTQRTLTQVEQLLANKILSLALNQAGQGSTRAPKAISIENATPNSIFESASTSRPIVIDLSPSTTTTTTWKTAQTQKSTDQKSIISGSTPEQLTWKPVITTTSKKDVETNTVSTSSTAKISQISTTKAPATMKVKSVTTSRPRTTTTQAPLGFGSLLWQTLFGGGLFASTTTPKPVKAKSVKTTPKSVDITPKPIQTTQKLETITVPSTTTLKTVDISKIQVSSPNSIIEDKLVASSIPISTTKKPLINNPNPRLPNVVTSTYSPEEDAKFLVELLRAVEQDNKAGSSKKTKLTQDDESFLRAILNGRGLTTTMPSSTTEISNAALLAALLKAQGIEPSTPATNIREQLQLAGLGQSVTESTAAKPATITTRPASSGATRPTDTTKKTVTPRPTSAPRIRTTTWSPSSTYPPSLFSSFSNYGTPVQSPGRGDNSGNSALFGATRAFSQFLGAAISGAAQQLQSLVRNGTRIVSEVMG